MAKRRERKSILIIEDQADIRNFAARVLNLEGYHVLQAEDGDDGLRLAGENQPALVLLDLRMPGRPGWAVLEEMKRSPQLVDVPVIVFSASADVHHREKAHTMGAADYLLKPLSAASLKEAVAHALGDKR